MPDWQGGTLKETYRESYTQELTRSFEPFKAGNWDVAFNPETFNASQVNCFELRDSPDIEPCGWTMLHYVAAGLAPASVATKLVETGAARCAKDSKGRTPFDVAMETGSADDALLAALRPQFQFQLSPEDETRLDAIEANFHALICEVSMSLSDKGKLALLPVRVLVERISGSDDQGEDLWNFPIPGMYGGFYNIQLERDSDGRVSHLICESWCRVAGGSGRRDKVTAEGTELLDSGFV